ncbi:PDZ domain-containing protein [Streptomyces tanashiensis]
MSTLDDVLWPKSVRRLSLVLEWAPCRPSPAPFCIRPRGVVRGAVLTLVFTGVLATAAATGSLPRQEDPGAERPAPVPAAGGGTVDSAALSRAAAAAMANGKSGKKAAEEFVSRSGDRWGAVYDKKEYAEFEQALGGAYTGVGLSAGRAGASGVRVTRGSPGARRAGRPADRRPAGLRRRTPGRRTLRLGGRLPAAG